jgi:23S rRNA (guanosine2251-2'-O)-methyltransferase
LDRLAGGRPHQGVIALAAGLGYVSLESIIARANEAWPPLVVVLDQVQDPHNLGAVVRTAETAGAHGLVVAARRTAPLSGAVARASAGAVEHLPIARVSNLVNAIKVLKKNQIWVIGVEPEGEIPWTGFDYTLPVALVLGGEHQGIRRLVSEHCDVRVRLPVRGRVASLNVSVAAGIVLYEVVRQRHPEGRSPADLRPLPNYP